jgi:hypothetical protein
MPRLLPHLLAALSLTATTATAQPRPLVGLNHFYLVPDSATFAAIQSSPFLRDTLGIFEARTTRRADQTYTGVYWYGTAHYFEFLPPGAGGRKPGESGLAWGSDNPADATSLFNALARIPGDVVDTVMITRGIDSTQVPWFLQTRMRSAATRSDVVTWVMHYASDFLTRWYGALPPTGAATSRTAVLERYAARVNAHARRGGVPFADIERLVFAVADSTRAQLLAECRAMGLSGKEASPCVGADGVVVELVSATNGRRGLQAITLRLRRPWDGPAERRFGRSRLRLVSDERAVWQF